MPSISGRAARIAGFTVGAVLAAGLALQTTSAAFSATTDNTGNSFAAGTVLLGDDDQGSALFQIDNLVPGDSHESCIEVEYTGSSFDLAPLRLYGNMTSDNGNLGQWLYLRFAEGTGGSFGDCSSFTNPVDLGPAVPIPSLNTTYKDFTGGWSLFTPTAGDTKRTYKVTVDLDVDAPNSVQGGSTAFSLTWEARSAD